MAHIGFSTNEYGTRISLHICDTCGREFWLCPAVEVLQTGWENCLAVECDSYDPDRDVDDIFDDPDAQIIRKSARFSEN